MEMMIVVAIIAIIVMLAIPAYQDYSIRAKISESLAVAAAAKTAITETCQINPLTTPSNLGSKTRAPIPATARWILASRMDAGENRSRKNTTTTREKARQQPMAKMLVG